jgi:hypothetical protein
MDVPIFVPSKIPRIALHQIKYVQNLSSFLFNALKIYLFFPNIYLLLRIILDENAILIFLRSYLRMFLDMNFLLLGTCRSQDSRQTLLFFHALLLE